MTETSSEDDRQAISPSLKSELYRLGCLGALLLVAGTVPLGLVWHWAGALQWLSQAALVWALVCYQAFRRLDLNRPEPNSPPYPDLGWGNRLTLLRAWLIATVAGFLLQPWPEGPVLSWLPGLLYFYAAMLDRVDGYVARRTRHSSLLGNELDVVSDALGLAIASLLAFGYGQVHWSYLLLGIAYYLFQGGIRWRKAHDLPVYPLPPAMHRRLWAGFQMGFLVVALWPLFYPPLTMLAGFAFMLPATIGFYIDWLIVSGRLDRGGAAADLQFKRLTDFSQSIFQPGLRVIIVVTLIASVLQSGYPPTVYSAIPWFNTVATVSLALAAAMILLGIAGRYFSLLMIGLLGWYYMENPLLAIDYVLFSCVVWSLMLGSGKYSLWQEDDRWLNRYDGA